ncbi:MAG: DNA polymerase III subunit beta [Prevotella sp.]|nr:DNA polymerase III subunit beta [Prevotella sp.]
MTLTISSTTLANSLTTLAKVIVGKNSMPIMDCFLFEVNNNKMTITASDSENRMITTVELLDEASESGIFAIQCQTILNAVKELPEQPLTIDINRETYTVEVNYQNGKYKFTAQQGAEEYPDFLDLLPENTITLTVDAKSLSDDISRSIFATANEEIRPVMNGIYLDMLPDHLAVVASDGHKLVRTRNFKVKSEEKHSFILPKKPASLLKAVLQKNEEDEVVIKFDGKIAVITYPDGELHCRLIEGRYPNYNSVIPKDNPNQLTIDRQAFAGALRRILPFASESSCQIRMHIEMGKLVLLADDIDFYTSAKEEVICDYNGTPMDIGFKGTSMSEILTNLEWDIVILELADPSRPCLVIPAEQPENEDITMLIMPMLLND